MAALSDSPLPRIIDLRHLRAGDLDPILEEETEVWRNSLDWDFRASAGLVRRFLEMQSLNGFSLLINGRPIGYSYFVSEERKGLIGDLYVLKNFVTIENEERLLSAVVDTLVRMPFVQRIESQLMMLRNGPRLTLPHRQFLRVHSRTFMEIDLGNLHFAEGPPAQPVLIDSWTERRQDDAATLIAGAYQGHIDSEINDQYRSPAGARRFLTNIVQYPGCGSFFQPASFVALDAGASGRLCGICLSSLVNSDVGHITQVCVSKAVRGRRVGYHLIRRSLDSLARHGCRKASLTVTSANQEAIALYQRMGFRKTRDFSAFVWSTLSHQI